MDLQDCANLRREVEEKFNQVPRSIIKSWLDQLAHFNLPVPSQALSQTLEDLSVIKLARSSRALLPVWLRVPEFAAFMNEKQDVCVERALLPSIRKLWDALNTKYESTINPLTNKVVKGEDRKVLALTPILQELIAFPTVKTGASIHAPLRDPECNLHVGKVDIYSYVQGIGLPVIIFEVKNEEISASNSEAIAQAATYYFQFVKSQRNAIVSNVPCLLISIRGIIMKVVGIVLFDGNAPYYSACESTLASFDGSNGDFHSFSILIASIHRCAEKLSSRVVRDMQAYNNNPNDFNHDALRLPWKCELLSLRLSFLYEDQIMNGKQVLRAKTLQTSHCQPQNPYLVVKWIKVDRTCCIEYGREVHYLMTQKGFAPILYGVESVNIGSEQWLMVVMEDVSKLENIELLDVVLDPESLTEQHRNLEREALDYMHNLGLVHGDFRNNNLLVGNETVRGVNGTKIIIPRVFIVDFDWAGRQGVVKYPHSLNREVPWRAGIVENGEIQREDDLHFHNRRYRHLIEADDGGVNVDGLRLDENNS